MKSEIGYNLLAMLFPDFNLFLRMTSLVCWSVLAAKCRQRHPVIDGQWLGSCQSYLMFVT